MISKRNRNFYIIILVGIYTILLNKKKIKFKKFIKKSCVF